MVRDITTATRPRRVTPWYLELDPQHRLIKGKTYRTIKRAIDFLLCLMIVPLAAPLLLLLHVAGLHRLAGADLLLAVANR